jgi:hypothetical protein
MSSQELQPEKSKSTQYIDNDFPFIENVKYAVAYYDPLSLREVLLYGSPMMKISMEDYAKLRVPEGIPYKVIELNTSPNETLPDLNFTTYSNDSLNMFYKYLNAL